MMGKQYHKSVFYCVERRMINMIKIENLTCEYNKETVFEETSIEITSGIWLLAGENGTGKSTLLNILSNNRTYWKNKNLTVKSSKMDLPKEVILLDDSVEIPMTMTEIDLYKIIMKMNDIKADSSYPVLHEGRKMFSYSVGERKIAVLRIVSQLVPKVLLIDEYLANLDETNVVEAINLLKNMSSKGSIIIVASNDEYVKKMFSSVIEIQNKKVVFSEK